MSSEPVSPLRRKQSSLDMSSRGFDTERSTVKTNSVINDLYRKFMTINNNIQVEHDLSGFNLIEYGKVNHKKFDQQTKLRKLENNAQLQRANLELENRSKKSPKRKNRESLTNPDGYLNLYRKFVNNPSKKLFDIKTESDSEEQKGKKSEDSTFGINYYGELKKHPRFLQYTVERAKSKEVQDLQEQKAKIENIENMRNEIKTMSMHNRTLLTTRPKADPQTNPQKIADNIFRKIYTKRNKDISAEQAKTDLRVAKIMDKQESILDTLDERSLSKDNYKKLKLRLGLIANELYHDDKRHQAKVHLPKIKKNAQDLSHNVSTYYE